MGISILCPPSIVFRQHLACLVSQVSRRRGAGSHLKVKWCLDETLELTLEQVKGALQMKYTYVTQSEGHEL